ncbi:hypothetical protein ACFW3D_32145 [Streptomyces sp. NPDC058864]
MQDDVSAGGAEAACRAADVVDVLLVVASDPDHDPEVVERLVRGLRAEVVELDVESVRPAPISAIPQGAKGSDPVTFGAIVVALSASGGVFSGLVETVRDWLSRHSARHRISLTIDGDTIELERASEAERRDLIDAYIRRHTGG